MTAVAGRDTVVVMKRSVYVVLITLVILLVAVGGRAVDGVRWLARGSRRSRLAAP